MNLVAVDNSSLTVECYLSYLPACMHVLGLTHVYSTTCDSLPECSAHALDYDNII